MGVDYHTAKLCKQLSVWGRTLTIGRQNWWLTPKETADLGVNWKHEYSRSLYAEPFFYHLGATRVDSVDICSSEQPTIIADLSVPSNLGQYTTVCDFGTCEHVADQATYWTNLCTSLEPQGHLLVVTPANQHCGHGLYQYSPEFFVRFKGLDPIVVDVVTYGWNVVRRPFTQASRFEFRTKYPAYIFAILKRNGDKFQLPVQRDTTITHKSVIPFASYLLDLPLVRRFQRILS